MADRKEYCKAWRAANKERVDLYTAEYRAKHAEERRLNKRKWYEANKDRCLEYAKVYASKNVERRRSQLKIWKAENRVLINASKRVWYAKNPGKAALYSKQQREKDKSIIRERIVAWEKRNAEKVRATKKAYAAKRYSLAGSHYLAFKECLASYRIGNDYWDVYNSCLISNPSVDHVQALVQSGSNAVENLCVTSRATNSSKHKKILIVWMAEQRRKETHNVCR